MTQRSNGGFAGALGDATSRYWDTVNKQETQARDEQARTAQLDLQREQLALQQEQARNARFDKLSNSLDSVFEDFGTNARFYDSDETAAIGQFQGEWEEARNEYNLSGNREKLDAFQKKYPGGALTLTKDGKTTPVTLLELRRRAAERKPTIELQDKYGAVVGAQGMEMGIKALSDPTTSPEDRAAITAAFASIGKGADPYQTFATLSATVSTFSPKKLAASLLANPPVNAKDYVILKGQVDGLRGRFTSPEDKAALDSIAARYDPSLAPPDQQEAATQNATLITNFKGAENATLQTPQVQLDAALLANQGTGLDLDKMRQTYPGIIAATNAMSGKTVGTVEYDMALLEFSKGLLPLTQLEQKVGVLANLAKQGGQGRAAIEGLRNDPDLMRRVGLTSADLDSALTRAGNVAKTESNAAILNDAGTVNTLTKMGVPGAAGMQALVDNGTLDPDTARGLRGYADAVTAAEKSGLDVTALTNSNEVTRQTVLGESVEETTRLTVGAQQSGLEAQTAASENATTRETALAPHVARLTEMQVNVDTISLREGYMAKGYSLTSIREKLAAGLPAAEAETAYKTFMAQAASAGNAVIVEGAKGPYLVNLTQAQMQEATRLARNGYLKANTDGMYVVPLAQAANIAAITGAKAGAAQNRNLLSVAAATADLVGPAAAQELITGIARGKASAQEQANLLTQYNTLAPYVSEATLSALNRTLADDRYSIQEKTNLTAALVGAQPYMGQAGVQEVLAQIASGKATVQEANLRAKVASSTLPFVDERLRVQVGNELAQGRYETLVATMKTRDFNWDNFKANGDVLGSLATSVPWERLSSIPAFQNWARRNGVDKKLYTSLGKWAQSQAAQDNKSGGADDRRVGLNQVFGAAKNSYTIAEQNSEYQGWIKELQALGIPKLDLDALTESAFAKAVADVDPKYKAKLQELGGKIVKYRKDTLDPLRVKMNSAEKALSDYVNSVPANPNQTPAVNGTGGSAGTLSGNPVPGNTAPGKAQQIVGGARPTTVGFTASAVYSGRNPDGSAISYCTRFAREYSEDANGLQNRALSGKWFGGDATSTLQNFRNNNAIFASGLTPQAALSRAGELAQGTLVFLSYAKNPGIDHVAVADGKGGFIQHSLPGFQGRQIEGSVNYMTAEQFFKGAGNATVSFGRVPAQGKAASPVPTAPPRAVPQRPPGGSAARPVAPSATPAKPPSNPGVIPRAEQDTLMRALRGTLDPDAPNPQQAKANLSAVVSRLVKAGYSQDAIRKMLEENSRRIRGK